MKEGINLEQENHRIRGACKEAGRGILGEDQNCESLGSKGTIPRNLDQIGSMAEEKVIGLLGFPRSRSFSYQEWIFCKHKERKN